MRDVIMLVVITQRYVKFHAHYKEGMTLGFPPTPSAVCVCVGVTYIHVYMYNPQLLWVVLHVCINYTLNL